MWIFAARTAWASSFQVGDFTTFTSADWGGTPGTDLGATTLGKFYDTVYEPEFGIVTVGSTSGYTMRFTDPESVVAYLPSVGPFAPLNGSVLDPITTASGGFGSEVVGLEFNVDFNDANVLPGTLGVRFGDLQLTNFAAGSPFEGLTVRQMLGDVNTLLGGGTTSFTITDLGSLVGDLNASFSEGNPSTFAQNHLIVPTGTTTVPEPATLTLLGSALVVFAGTRRSRRRQPQR
ncbi:MAG TPA: PEP-CTERM sorting domain-containing protein [Vicinamibacterales bacterium]